MNELFNILEILNFFPNLPIPKISSIYYHYYILNLTHKFGRPKNQIIQKVRVSYIDLELPTGMSICGSAETQCCIHTWHFYWH